MGDIEDPYPYPSPTPTPTPTLPLPYPNPTLSLNPDQVTSRTCEDLPSSDSQSRRRSTCKLQQHTQRAAAHAKSSNARKVQLHTLNVHGYLLNGTMIAIHHGNSGCASVSVCGKFTWSKLMAGTSPQYDHVTFCADANSNPHHDTNLGSSSGHTQTCVVIQDQLETKRVTFTFVTSELFLVIHSRTHTCTFIKDEAYIS